MSLHQYPSRRPFALTLRAFEQRVTKGDRKWAPQDEDKNSVDGFDMIEREVLA